MKWPQRFMNVQTAKWRIGLLLRSKARLTVSSLLLITVLYAGYYVMWMPVEIDICPEPSKAQEFYRNKENVNITIITMYLNLGSHTRTSLFFFKTKSYMTDDYRGWLPSWGKLTNNVIAFFDDNEFIETFKRIRSHLPASATRVIKIDKSDLSAFKYRKRVEEIIANPSFKVTYPSNYTCTMDAKYDALEMALNMKDIDDKYFAWMDIGLFRRLQASDPPFTLQVPPDFNSSKVGFSEVQSRNYISSLSPQDIYQQNIVWVAGGFVLGMKSTLFEFIKSYKLAAEQLRAQGLADTDQQVVASMYSPIMAWKQKVSVMTYACPRGSFGLYGYGYLYFCLPYICKASAECKMKTHAETQDSTLKVGD